MKRREFLPLMTAIAAAPILGRCASSSTHAPPPQTVIRSRDGLLELDLTAELQEVSLAGRRAKLMAYNGEVPGPRLEVRAGDRIHIRFTNALPESTNLHYHGLHVSPTGLADNPFRVVAPGETVDYDFTLPADHPSGLFWYHPHAHGFVASQVFSGLAGPLVVRGTVDDLPEIQAAQEVIWVLQDFDLDRQGQVQHPRPIFRMWGREGGLITVNGQAATTVDLAEGGLLRLRLLNASASRIYQLQLRDHPWWLMATDGLALDRPMAQDDLVLSPGERADLLVMGTETPGTYPLLSLPYDRGIGAMAASMGHGHGGMHQASTAPEAIAHLRYQGTPVSTPTLPPTLSPVAALPEPTAVREFIFDHGIDPETQDPFLINGRAFGHHRVDTEVALNTVEDWVLVNKAGMDHPFHLHTNHFQVISRNGQPEPLRAWKDVVNLRPYETVRIRIPFRDFAGQTVYHCHILDHEDQGMMGIVKIS